MITGEPMPVDVEAGAAVVGGTLNGQGTLIVRVERVGADATLAQIVQLVRDAQAPPGPRCSSVCLCRTMAVVSNAPFSRRRPRPTSSAWRTASPGASCRSS
jgi:high-affinity K+ transport system ATPase subunit B